MNGRYRALMTVTLLTGGCATAPPPPTHRLGPISTSLVMPSAALLGPAATASNWPADPAKWEYGRNDEALSTALVAPAREVSWVQIRIRDDQRTSNGRPRETSSTRTWMNSYRIDN